jgi:hypothetical protein
VIRSDLWHLPRDSQAKAPLEDDYRFEAIDTLVHDIVMREAVWQQFFDRLGARPLTVAYEDIAALRKVQHVSRTSDSSSSLDRLRPHNSLSNVPFSTLVIPNEPYENLYEVLEELLSPVHVFTKRLALTLKQVLACDGVTIRQHNEPAGGQDVWHYHVHVVPRFTGDLFHEEAGRPVLLRDRHCSNWLP